MLYVKYVFSGHQSLSLNIQDNSWRGLNVYDGRVGRTLSQEIFKRFWNNFDFFTSHELWYEGYNLTYTVWFCTSHDLWYESYNLMYIVYRKCFRVDRKSIFVGSVRPTRKWLSLSIPLTSKRKAYFYLQWVTR